MSTHDRSTDAVIAAFDEHLRRARGVCPEVRRNYARVAHAFLQSVFDGGEVDLTRICVRDVVEFVSASTHRYQPATVQLMATSLRSFFRFARAAGLRADRLEDAVPAVPRRRNSLPRHLGTEQFTALLASLDVCSPRALRDRAIILCVARLGLRASEVARLRLEDVDWRNATVHVVTRKTGHGALLPLPDDLGRALADYLRDGRPATPARQVFVLSSVHADAPINRQLVSDAVARALRHAGIDAPVRGANLLRHSFATDLLGHGATIKEIADVFVRFADHHVDLRQSRCHGVARGGAALAGGGVVTGEVQVLVEEFIVMRRGLGYRLCRQADYLRDFARYLEAAGHHGPVPLTASVDWATSTSTPDPRNHARRLSIVRGFLRHLSALDGATEVPPTGLLGPTCHRTPPHVYSDAEISDLLRAAAALPPHGGLRPHCYVTLFSVLACTGLRISEALALSREDADLVNGALTVRAGKNGRTRLVPLHPSALAPLREYAARRDAYGGPAAGADAFFRTERNERLSYGTVSTTFKRMRRQLGWTAAGRTRTPRIHDLRHRMVVRRIQAWHAEGVDVDRKIAVLATYLGHVRTCDLFWYLSAAPELMCIIADRFEDYTPHPQAGVS